MNILYYYKDVYAKDYFHLFLYNRRMSYILLYCVQQNPCQHPIIILRDVAFVDVSALLSFVYQGEVYVSQDRLTAFLHTAELLHIKGLTDQHTASTIHTGTALLTSTQPHYLLYSIAILKSLIHIK